jgi:hypothetical protein
MHEEVVSSFEVCEVMENIVQRLMVALETSAPIDFRSVPQDVLFEATLTLSDGPFAADLFALFSHQAISIPRLASAMVYMVQNTMDPGSMAEIVCYMADGLNLQDEIIRGLHTALLERSKERSTHYGLRSHALRGALILSQDRPSLLRLLQAHLIEIDTSDDGMYLRHVSKIIGTVLAHERDTYLEELLNALAGVYEACDEADMELGLLALGRALDEQERDRALSLFRHARDCFALAISTSEQRPDAMLYFRCVNLLLCFLCAFGGRA